MKLQTSAMILTAVAVLTAPRWAAAQDPSLNPSYDPGATIQVKIWWESFLDPCLPDATCTVNGLSGTMADRDKMKATLMAAVRDVVYQSGIDLDVKWAGFNAEGVCTPGTPCPECSGNVCETPPAGNHLWINMDLGPNGSGSGGSGAVKNGNSGKVEFKATWDGSLDGSGAFDWGYNYYARPGNPDFYSVMKHEFGHTLGFGHGTNPLGIMTGSYGSFYGPSEGEKTLLRNAYGTPGTSFTRLTSYNGGTSDWFDNPVTGLPGNGTYREFGAFQDTSHSMFCYSKNPNRDPAVKPGANTLGSFDPGVFFGGLQTYSGVDCDGRSGEAMLTWVDGSNDSRQVKVIRSTNGGTSWYWRNPPTSLAHGTPSIARMTDRDVWILSYIKAVHSSSGSNDEGKIVVRVSTNDGATWGPEIFLDGTYLVQGGVSIASHGRWVRITAQGHGVGTTLDQPDFGNLRILKADFNVATAPVFLGWTTRSEYEMQPLRASITRSGAGWLMAAPVTVPFFGSEFTMIVSMLGDSAAPVWRVATDPPLATAVGRPDWWTAHLIWAH